MDQLEAECFDLRYLVAGDQLSGVGLKYEEPTRRGALIDSRQKNHFDELLSVDTVKRFLIWCCWCYEDDVDSVEVRN